MHNTLGIKSQPVGTHPLASALQLDQAPSPAMLDVLQSNVDRTYNRFKDIVATGRHMDRPQVDSIARGHVYTGSDALQLGLVDQEGGFLEALKRAHQLAGYSEPARIVFYPDDLDPLEEALAALGGQNPKRLAVLDLGHFSPVAAKNTVRMERPPILPRVSKCGPIPQPLTWYGPQPFLQKAARRPLALYASGRPLLPRPLSSVT